MQFYDSQLARSWAPAYLAERGISGAAMRQWRIGYAPGGWVTLTGHLRALGHDDDAIQAAGLARNSSAARSSTTSGTGSCSRSMTSEGTSRDSSAAPAPEPAEVPKYLNSPETSSYHKGSLLFGLHQARDLLARGATPVIVEGPFDAIAVTMADPGRHAAWRPAAPP